MIKQQSQKKLIYLFSIMNMISSTVILNFKTLKPVNLTQENLMQNLYENRIYIEIKVGTPEQKIPLFLKMREYSSFITSYKFNNSLIPKFNYLNSKTFNYLEDIKIKYYKYDFTEAFLGSDNFDFGNENKCENLTIIIANDLRKSSNYLSGIIGLKLTPNENYLTEKYNMISLLKEKKLINDYSFSLKYKNENEGEFIIGNYLYNKNIKNDKIDDFIKTSNIGYQDSSLQWIIGLDIYSNRNLTDKNIITSLSYESGFFEGSGNYKNNIINNFFGIYFNNGKCKQVTFKLYLIYFVCDDDINIENFPILDFYHNKLNYTFTFDYKDLFYHFENKLYFMVIFQDYHSSTWNLGKIFFKKYHLFFDREKKIFGVYIKENQFYFPISLIFIIILSLALVSLIVYIKFFITIQKRKIRANELQDDYDYVPQDNYKNKLFVSRNKNVNLIETFLI